MIGGDKEEMKIFKENSINFNNNIKLIDLLVEGSYHTPFYEKINIKMDDVLNEINYCENNIILYSNFRSIIYDKTNFKDLIKNQIYNKVDWFKTMKELKKLDFINIKEIGCSNEYLKNIFKNI